MKAIIFSFLLFLTSVTCHAQKMYDSAFVAADAYRQRAKSQRITAAVLGITGLGLFFYGASNFQFFSEQQDEKVSVPVIAGSILLASAIPFIIASDKNSKKAKKLSTSFMLQQTPPLVAAIQSTTCYPSVSVRIHF